MVDFGGPHESDKERYQRISTAIDEIIMGERMEPAFMALPNCTRRMLESAREKDTDYAYRSFTAFVATLSTAFELGPK